MLHIHSEHAIGFLKGRFSSLKSLPINITNAKTHKFSTYWIAAAIGIHNFALDCEAEERSADSDYDVAEDPFVAEGLSSDSDLDEGVSLRQPGGGGTRLQQAKAHRENLKVELFKHKVVRHRQRWEDRTYAL